MTDQQDPPRLLDDLGTPPEMRDALRRSAAIAPVFDAAGGLARLEQSIQAGGAGAAGAGGGGLGAAGAGAVTAAVVALAVIGGAVVWGTGVWGTGGGAPAPEQEQSDVVTAPEPVAAPEVGGPDEASGVTEAGGPVTPEAEPVVALEAQPRAREAATRPSRTDEDALAAEMRELAEARRALASEPARALAMLERGRREHGARSLFAEEREALSVLALDALGRDADARRRGQRFLASHPESPHAERIRRALAD